MINLGLKRFSLGFGVTLLIFVSINWISYYVRSTSFDVFRITGNLITLLSPSSIMDGLERIGFPFCFWEAGGYAGGYHFNPLAFFADLAISITVSGMFGLHESRTARRKKINLPQRS